MSRMHTSGFGTIGAAFLYLEALNRQAMVRLVRLVVASKGTHYARPARAFTLSLLENRSWNETIGLVIVVCMLCSIVIYCIY